MSTEPQAIRGIAAAIRAVRGTGRSRVVHLGTSNHYFQVASFGGPRVLIEVPSSTYLPEPLSPGDEQRLHAFGFLHPTDNLPNWWIGLEEATDDEIDSAATALFHALVTVYRVPMAAVFESLGLPTAVSAKSDGSQTSHTPIPKTGIVPSDSRLRAEHRTDGSRLNLWAALDAEGNLQLHGQDLGPVTKPVSYDGEYEYVKTIAAADVPRLIEATGGDPGEDVLHLLARYWSGQASFELERVIDESGIPVKLWTWS